MRRRRASLGAWLRRIGLTALVAVLFWCGGFVWFVGRIPRAIDAPDVATDAIVALTGGSNRLAAGMALLDQNRAKKLFISGVYRGTDVRDLLRLAERAPGALECCIVLGHSATDTRGNARESAAWMAAEGYGSLRLVTANYHMPRSLLEFRRAMPSVRIVGHPVFPQQARVRLWWRQPQTAYLIASEFTKYLVAHVDPRALWTAWQRP